MSKPQTDFKICGIYDTETTNIGSDSDTRAFPVLFIVNDLRNTTIADYTYDGQSDDLRFYRHDTDMLQYVDELIEWGESNNHVPVICAYNLMFDLQPLMHSLSMTHEMKVNAQTSTSAYTVDIVSGKQTLLRFWDTFYLEMGGLRAMGETCGLPKAVGDWDYTLVRTPDTSLSERELYYAGRDTQVIPAYLNYLLRSNDWMKESDLGCRVLTKTSLVRQMAFHEIGKLKFRRRNGRKASLLSAFETTCKQEFPDSFDIYALRKACFRGGLTFTSANYASQIHENVASLDVTSMHHTFINGRKIPVHFTRKYPAYITAYCDEVIGTTRQQVLTHYYQPFLCAFHAKIRFRNLRLKKNTVFSRAGIAIIPEGKFVKKATATDLQENLRVKYAEENIKMSGWVDRAINPVFAFGKLMSADVCDLHINECELWCIKEVYDFDSYEVVLGEGTRKFAIPPDYVTLQSNVLFERKQDMKHMLKQYREGTPYAGEIPASIPEGIGRELQEGTASERFLQSYYNSTVKGMFNGIYGTQAQDLLKPSFKVEEGDIRIDRDTIVTPEKYDEMKPKKVKVLYTYGMRIVAGSRMHLVIALELLNENLGARVRPTGGDTDSIKISTDRDVTDDMLAHALDDISDASDLAISTVQRRNRTEFPQVASQLTGIGHFDIETASESTRWDHHMEAWNKARISEENGSYHITCAGLSRPRDAYHIETLCDDLGRQGYSFEQIAKNVLGYNVFIQNSVSHSLQKSRPDVKERYMGKVKDYMGNTSYVNAPASIALYPSGRWLGEETKRASFENLRWLNRIGIRPDERERIITYERNTGRIYRMNDSGEMEIIMEGAVRDEG